MSHRTDHLDHTLLDLRETQQCCRAKMRPSCVSPHRHWGRQRVYLVAVVSHWLSDAGQNQQFPSFHCGSCNTNINMLKTATDAGGATDTVSVGGLSRECVCVFSLVELMRWRRTAREPTLLRSLLFSSFWRTNITSRSGKEFARRREVKV